MGEGYSQKKHLPTKILVYPQSPETSKSEKVRNHLHIKGPRHEESEPPGSQIQSQDTGLGQHRTGLAGPCDRISQADLRVFGRGP